MDTNKYWAVHGGSDSYFAAKNAKDAAELVAMFNKISIEYDMPPTSKVDVVDESELDFHSEELKRRDSEGDDFYLMP